MDKEDVKLYRVIVSDPVSGGRLTRVVMATSNRMAESMIPAGENDVVTSAVVDGLEAQITFALHPQKPKIKDQRTFFNGMSRALGLNPDLVRGLELSIPGIQNHYFRLAVAQVIEDLRERGEDVQSSMVRFKDILSNDKIAMLEAGAQSGELGHIFKEIAVNVEKQSGVMKKVTSALTYPAIVLVMGIIAVLILSFTLFKQMKGMFNAFNADLPFITVMFVNMTDFLTAYWWAVVPALIIIPSIMIRKWPEIYRQQWMQDFIDKPKYLRQLHWKMNMARCLRGFGLLLGANVPIQKALELTGAITEHISIKTFFNELEKGILGGQTVDEATQKNSVYLKDEAMTFVAQVRMGSQTGSMEEVVKKMAEVYEEEVDEQVGMLSQFVEPIIMMVMGVFIGTIVLAVFLPMVNLYQAII